ncbi:hypothetical protein C882_2024 [Caenispirillum salinarum AK4]|uniref:Lipoprotein n=1 Tax=Caenispirillum salinarum AK4 TaxID=1238182 RepID=K9GM66_9PROT|nr:hypothetical protein [Caenispirillum salinarum]EKV27095.1 hypothetical protein C882_2024 [Caenispirillum salinarum AK4]
MAGALLALTLTLTLGLTACADPPRPFARDAAPPDARLARPVTGSVVAVPPTDGAPAAVARALAAAVARGLAAAEVPADVDAPRDGEHRVISSLLDLAADDGSDTLTVILGLELRDGSGRPLMITQARGRVPGALWTAAPAGPDEAEALAAAADAVVAAAIPALAAAEQARVPVPDGQPLGLLDGIEPLPGPGGTTTPGVAGLPRVEILPVTGAPGGGSNNEVMARAAASVLRQVGAPIAADAGTADAALAALVSITPEIEQRERIRIVWSVMTPDGAEIGTVKQENVLPRGYALRDWPDLAFLIAGNAVDGIVPLLRRVHGQKDEGPD